MRDYEIVSAFRPILIQGFQDRNLLNIAVEQNNQKIIQGANSTPTIYFNKISSRRYGFLKSQSFWDSVLLKAFYVERQKWECVYQLNAFMSQDIYDATAYTASDLLSVASDILQSVSAQQQLLINGVGIYRIMELNNPYFVNDKDEFQASPSFDITFTYDSSRTIETNIIQTVQAGIYRV